MPTMNTGKSSSPGLAGLGERLPRAAQALAAVKRAMRPSYFAASAARSRRADIARSRFACLVVPHRLRVIAEIVEGLAQTEADIDAGGMVKLRPLDDEAHPVDQRPVGFRHALRLGQRPKYERQSV